MILHKLLALGSMSLLGLALDDSDPDRVRPTARPSLPRPRRRKTLEPGGDMRKAYDLLRRLRSDNRNVRPSRGTAQGLDRTRHEALSSRPSRRSNKARSTRPASSGSPPMTWPGPSTTPGTPRTSTSTTTCPPPPDAPKGRKTRTSGLSRDLRHAYDPDQRPEGGRGRRTGQQILSGSVQGSLQRGQARCRRRSSRPSGRTGPSRRGPDPRSRASGPGHRSRRPSRAQGDPRPRRIAPSPRKRRAGLEPPKAKKDHPEPKEKKDRPEPKEKKDRPER